MSNMLWDERKWKQAQSKHTSSVATLSYGYDTMGRLNQVTGADTNAVVAGSVSYGVANELPQMQYGALTDTRTYNNLLQLTLQQVTGTGTQMDLQYRFTANQNNGRMASQLNAVSGEEVTYQYDAVNRLISAVTTTNPSVPQWGQGFQYDGFGNLRQKNVTKGTAPSISLTVDETTNQVMLSGQ